MKYPCIRDVRAVVESAKTTQSPWLNEQGKRKWVPTRPSGYPSFLRSLRAAWLVFVGAADAVTYPGQ